MLEDLKTIQDFDTFAESLGANSLPELKTLFHDLKIEYMGAFEAGNRDDIRMLTRSMRAVSEELSDRSEIGRLLAYGVIPHGTLLYCENCPLRH